MKDSSMSSSKHGNFPLNAQPSLSQADGTAADGTSGVTEHVSSETPVERTDQINSSASNDAPSQMPANTTRDSAGEVGDPTGRGTLDAPRENTQPTTVKDKKQDNEAA